MIKPFIKISLNKKSQGFFLRKIFLNTCTILGILATRTYDNIPNHIIGDYFAANKANSNGKTIYGKNNEINMALKFCICFTRKTHKYNTKKKEN